MYLIRFWVCPVWSGLVDESSAESVPTTALLEDWAAPAAPSAEEGRDSDAVMSGSGLRAMRRCRIRSGCFSFSLTGRGGGGGGMGIG